jgi:hypothetical protein
MTAELNIYPADSVPTRTARCDVSSTNPTSTAGLQLLNFWLLKVMLRCVNDDVTTMNPGHQVTGHARVIWSEESSFTPFPTPGIVYVWRTPKDCLAPTVRHRGGSVTVWAATISRYSILLVPLLPFMAEQGSTWTGWVIRCCIP